MSACIHLYSSTSTGVPRADLEDDLDQALGDAVAITGGGAGVAGWNIDLEVAEDVKLESLVPRLLDWLREWGVPEDTQVEVFPTSWAPGEDPRRVWAYPQAD